MANNISATADIHVIAAMRKEAEIKKIREYRASLSAEELENLQRAEEIVIDDEPACHSYEYMMECHGIEKMYANDWLTVHTGRNGREILWNSYGDFNNNTNGTAVYLDNCQRLTDEEMVEQLYIATSEELNEMSEDELER